MSAPLYESPGGTVPTVVTAYDVPGGYTATISARGTRGCDCDLLGANRASWNGSKTTVT